MILQLNLKKKIKETLHFNKLCTLSVYDIIGLG